jgi:acetylornithine deacetylase
MMAKVQSYVDDLNKDITVLENLQHGPVSKYTLPAENRIGKLELTWEEHFMEGIACSLTSCGYK